jgi:hypothetical protein
MFTRFNEFRSYVFVGLVVLLTVSSGASASAYGQIPELFDRSTTVSETPRPAVPFFRSERRIVPGGAELITIFARNSAFAEPGSPDNSEMPLVSVLRDTLGDNIPENDKLRFVWMLNHTRPTFWQRISAGVPFLYSGMGNKKPKKGDVPPPVADLIKPGEHIVSAIAWFTFRRIVLNEISLGAKASALQYDQNVENYRRSGIESAIAVLSLYQETSGEKVLTDAENKDIQARLSLTDQPFAYRFQSENLHRAFNKKVASARDFRSQNWELLRQYSEDQGFYFDPLEMPDGKARHAVIWIAEEDLNQPRVRKFDGRFLNVRDPWTDSRVRDWKGYRDVRWYDEDDREVEAGTPGARKKTLIPIALYGLDHPKIPAILIDFRDSLNPKKRELSRRVLQDVTNNVLALSRFSSVPYFLGRYVYEFTAARRGLDINQQSRMRSYMQLKLLVALDASLDDEFRGVISKASGGVSINPLENSIEAEAKLARLQYQNLIDYADRPNGLAARLERDRGVEMVKLSHGRKAQVWFKIARGMTFGLYQHREKPTPALVAKMDTRRQLDFHERFIRETAYATAKPEIDTDMSALRRSMEFIAENGAAAGDKTARSIATIFMTTSDDNIRSLAIAGLYRVNNQTAKRELLAIYSDDATPVRWRTMSASYLRRARDEGQKMSPANLTAVSNLAGN